MEDIFGLPKKKRKRTLSSADKKRIAAKQHWKCKKCRQELPARFHVDHKKRFSEGGSDTDSNLQALCPNCHARKTENERHRKKQKKIKKKESDDDFGLGLFNTRKTRRSSKKDTFGLGLIKTRKRKKKKKDDLLGDFGF